MKGILKEIFVFVLIVGFYSCKPNNNIYNYSDWQLKYDSNSALKKADRIKKLEIILYTDSVFPNKVICNMSKIMEVKISSEHFLNKLILNRSNFKDIKDSILLNKNALDSIKTIKSLSFLGFTFKSFPYELCQLPSLESLSIIFGNIKEFPKDLSQFKNLKFLDLTLNDIETFPDSIIFPSSLQELVLINNKLTDFPVNVVSSTALRIIKLSNSEIPYDWANQNKFSTENKIRILKSVIRYPQIRKVYMQADSKEEKAKILKSIKEGGLQRKVKILTN